MYNRQLNDNHITTLKTRWDLVKVEKLVKKACWKVPPFEALEGKGFKDSLIVENLVQNKSVFLTDTTDYLIFVCNDGKANEAVEKEFEKAIIVKDSKDLEEQIDLLLKDLSVSQIEIIKENASRLFKEKYFKPQLFNEIKADFETLLKEPKEANVFTYALGIIKKEYNLRDDFNFNYIKTTFQRMYSGRTFCWESEILVDGLYEESTTNPISSLLDQYSLPVRNLQQTVAKITETFTLNSTFYPNNEPDYSPYLNPSKDGSDYIVYTPPEKSPKHFYFLFSIKWNSKIDTQNEIEESKILNTTFKRQIYPHQAIFN